MIPALVGIFGAGATAAVALARNSRHRSLWGFAFLNVLLAFHELAFGLQPPSEWIRADLIVTVPLFALGNLFTAWRGFQHTPGWWVFGLATSGFAAPIWFVWLR